MTANAQPAPDAASWDTGHALEDLAPASPRNLARLFVRPRSFFSRRSALEDRASVLLVTWCYGISYAIDRVGAQVMKSDFARPTGRELLGPAVLESWAGFWLWVLASGALAGASLWWFGGWWYRLRLRWSSSGGEPDAHLARLAYVYSSFVLAGPVILTTVIQTSIHPHYLAAHRSDDLLVVPILLFAFWSIGTSYAAVTTLFPVVRWKARMWFVVLPALVYAIALGAVGALLG